MNFATFAMLVDDLEGEQGYLITPEEAHQMLDIARQRRWPLSINVVGKLAAALKGDEPEGFEHVLLVDGSRVRHMYRIKGEKTSLDDLESE